MLTAPPLADPTITALLTRLHATADANDPEVLTGALQAAADRAVETESEVADVLTDGFMPVDPGTGTLLHVLAGARRPGRIIEFGTSMGLSTIYLAAALDPAEPPMVATELDPHKVATACAHLAEAGLGDRVELRAGDALETLADFADPISLLFLDGWKGLYLRVVQLLQPMLVPGALVIADDTMLFPDLCAPYLDYVGDPANGFATASLALDDGLEISTRLA